MVLPGLPECNPAQLEALADALLKPNTVWVYLGANASPSLRSMIATAQRGVVCALVDRVNELSESGRQLLPQHCQQVGVSPSGCSSGQEVGPAAAAGAGAGGAAGLLSKPEALSARSPAVKEKAGEADRDDATSKEGGGGSAEDEELPPSEPLVLVKPELHTGQQKPSTQQDTQPQQGAPEAATPKRVARERLQDLAHRLRKRLQVLLREQQDSVRELAGEVGEAASALVAALPQMPQLPQGEQAATREALTQCAAALDKLALRVGPHAPDVPLSALLRDVPALARFTGHELSRGWGSTLLPIAARYTQKAQAQARGPRVVDRAALVASALQGACYMSADALGPRAEPALAQLLDW